MGNEAAHSLGILRGSLIYDREQALAKHDGITRRYIRRLVGFAFLSPELVEAISQGRQPVALTATRLTELDLPLDWTEQRRLLRAESEDTRAPFRQLCGR